MSRFRGIALVVLTAAAAYALLIEPAHIEVTRHSIGSPPSGSPSIQIVQLSDLHLQSMGRREAAVVRAIESLKPDLLVLSGDVIDAAENLSVLDSFLAMLGPGQKVAVLGNWEHWSGVNLTDLRALYSKHGVRLLINEKVQYRFGARALTVIGLDDFTGGRPEPALITPPPKGEGSVVIQHSPGWFRSPDVAAVDTRASLCLAGHTHGGQIALFGLPVWTPRGSGDFVAGRYDLAMCPLYVSRGIGTSIVPVRFGARPEIAVFSL